MSPLVAVTTTEPISIHEAVARALADVPPEHVVAFVAHADIERARIAVMVRTSVGWTFEGYLDKPYHGTLEGGAELRFSR